MKNLKKFNEFINENIYDEQDETKIFEKKDDSIGEKILNFLKNTDDIKVTKNKNENGSIVLTFEFDNSTVDVIGFKGDGNQSSEQFYRGYLQASVTVDDKKLKIKNRICIDILKEVEKHFKNK